MRREDAEELREWIGFACFIALLGLVVVLPRASAKSPQAKKRLTPEWAQGLLALSYCLLVPSLAFRMFHYDIVAAGGIELQRSSETFASLARQGRCGGLSILSFYVIAVPAFKLGLVFAAETLHKGTAKQVLWARRCVIVLKIISKFALRDIFSYALLVHLVLDLDSPPLVSGSGDLDYGFSCFALYVVCSTIALLGLSTPERPDGAGEEGRGARTPSTVQFDASRYGGPRLSKLMGVLALFSVFIPSLFVGLTTPCIGLRLQEDSLYAPSGPIAVAFRPALDELHLSVLLHDDVTFWDCVRTYARWTSAGDFNGFVALLLLVVAMIGLPVVSMCVLVFTAVQRYVEPAASSPDPVPPRRQRLAFLLKRLSSLDVAIIGVALVATCGSAYTDPGRAPGMTLPLKGGLLALTLAELCHNATFFWVVGWRCAEPQVDTDLEHKPERNVHDTEDPSESSSSTR